MVTARRHARVMLACCLPLAAAACGLHPRGDNGAIPIRGDEIVITEAEITELHVRSAWDVIKRKAPQISYRENGVGQPTAVWRRGRNSIVLSDVLLCFVDDIRITDLRALEEMPASSVESIRIIGGIDATTLYGTNAGSGVILVRTRNAT